MVLRALLALGALTAGEFLNLLNNIALRAINRDSTELLCNLETLSVCIEAGYDNLADTTSLFQQSNHEQTNSARADYNCGFTDLRIYTLYSVHCYAERLEQSALGEGNVIGHRDDVGCTNGHVLSKCARKVSAIEWTVVANVYLATIAILAGVVEEYRVCSYALTNLEVCRCILANFSDYARELMAEDCRRLDVIGICDCRIPAIERVIGTADTLRVQ